MNVIVHVLADQLRRASKAFNMMCSHCGVGLVYLKSGLSELTKALGFRACAFGWCVNWCNFSEVNYQCLPIEIMRTL